MSLEQAHAPVPYFNEKLLKSVERTLKRFGPNEPFERTSWEIVDDRNVFFRELFYDSYRAAIQLPSLSTDNIAKAPKDSTIPEELHPKDLFFRVDHQTFRKLPRSNGIVFGVSVLFSSFQTRPRLRQSYIGGQS